MELLWRDTGLFENSFSVVCLRNRSAAKYVAKEQHLSALLDYENEIESPNLQIAVASYRVGLCLCDG